MIFIYFINVHFDLTIILHYIKCRDQKDAAAITLQYTGFYIKKKHNLHTKQSNARIIYLYLNYEMFP